jgi:hypothetical protein
LLFCGLLGVLSTMGVVTVAAVVMAAHGVMWSWVYLRFYQVKDGSVGDAAESFTFVDFFPQLIQPVVGIISGRVWGFVRCSRAFFLAGCFVLRPWIAV